MINRYSWAGAWVFVVLVAGCAQEPPPTICETEGTVRLDGKPLKRVTVRFYPTAGARNNDGLASGVTDDKGHFKLTCNGRDGAVAGENRVTITESEYPPELANRESKQKELGDYLEKLGGRPLPAKYASFAKTPLRVTVSAEKKEHEIELSR
jgi:hypothetical protein